MTPTQYAGMPAWVNCCPYAILKSQEAVRVWQAYRWFEKSSFGIRYPNCGIGLIRAVEAYDLGMNAGLNERTPKDK